jgi:Bacterial regulatory proteins, lacI family
MSPTDKQETDRERISACSPCCGETMVNAIVTSNARPSTIYDVAGAAGVSTATVSRVVNGVGMVSCDIKARVLAAISTLRFCPNSYAVEMGRAAGRITRKRGFSSACADPGQGKAAF